MKFFRIFTLAAMALCLTAVVGCDSDDEKETAPGPLAVPTPHFDEDAATTSTLSLKWETVEDAWSYTVKWWKEGEEGNASEENGAATSRTLTRLESETTYFAQVMACSAANVEYDSAYSSAVSCTTLAEPEPEETEPEEPEPEEIYFEDDFSYLTDDEGKTLVDIVADEGTYGVPSYNNSNARIDSYTIDGETVQQILTDRGYVIETYSGTVSTSDGIESSKKNVYTFTHIGYLAFGNSSNTVGIHLPPVEGVGDEMVLSFDWCPYIGTDDDNLMNTVDKTQLEIEIECGANSATVTVPKHEFTVETGIDWIHYKVSLTESLNIIEGEDVSIFIRPVDWKNNTKQYRWMLDNLMIYTPGE